MYIQCVWFFFHSRKASINMREINQFERPLNAAIVDKDKYSRKIKVNSTRMKQKINVKRPHTFPSLLAQSTLIRMFWIGLVFHCVYSFSVDFHMKFDIGFWASSITIFYIININHISTVQRAFDRLKYTCTNTLSMIFVCVCCVRVYFPWTAALRRLALKYYVSFFAAAAAAAGNTLIICITIISKVMNVLFDCNYSAFIGFTRIFCEKCKYDQNNESSWEQK